MLPFILFVPRHPLVVQSTIHSDLVRICRVVVDLRCMCVLNQKIDVLTVVMLGKHRSWALWSLPWWDSLMVVYRGKLIHVVCARYLYWWPDVLSGFLSLDKAKISATGAALELASCWDLSLTIAVRRCRLNWLGRWLAVTSLGRLDHAWWRLIEG